MLFGFPFSYCAIAHSAEPRNLNRNLNTILNRSSIPELQSKVSFLQAMEVTVPQPSADT